MFIKAIFFVFIVLFSSNVFADQLLEEIGSVLEQYDSCTGDYYLEADLDEFKAMFLTLSYEGQVYSSIEITELNFDNVTLKNLITQRECTMYTDVYEGRCNYAICY